MPDDDFEPRENDHLVEPMFAGLGVGEEDAADDEAEPQNEEVRTGFLAALLRSLRRWFGRG